MRNLMTWCRNFAGQIGSNNWKRRFILHTSRVMSRRATSSLGSTFRELILKEIDAKLIGNMLVVKAKREEKKETRKRDLIRREVSYGNYERTMTLPEGVKAEDIKATYRDGVLELTAPAPKELAPKEVRIQVEGTQPEKIETEKAAA